MDIRGRAACLLALALAGAAAASMMSSDALAGLLKQKKGSCGCSLLPRADHVFEDVQQYCPEISGGPELMACLPASMRKNYVLMYDTGSPQCASADSPRLVLFSDDGRSMVSFPGKHGAPGCDSSSVEFVGFNSKNKRYEPAKLIFDKQGKPHFHSSPSEETGKCTQCHDNDFHPNWSAYPAWPGAYGGNHSRIKLGTVEAKNFALFIAKAGKDPIYSQLVPVPSQKGPYSMTVDTTSGELNGKLNMAIVRRNSERIARKFKETAGYDRLKYRLLSGLLAGLNPSLKGCQPFDPGEMKEMMVAVSGDFRAERELNRTRMENPGKNQAWALPDPDYYPPRAELESGNSKKRETIEKDRFVTNAVLMKLMAQKLGITDTDDFYNRPSSTRYSGGKKLFSIDRTADFDQHLGGLLAKALLADISQDESKTFARERYPYSSYFDPVHGGVEENICARYDDADLEKSTAMARGYYGDEECRNGIREYPEQEGVAQAPSICEKLRRSEGSNHCPIDSDTPLSPGSKETVAVGLSAALNAGNPLVSCAGCHDGTHAGIPKFPFGDPKALGAELREPGSNLKHRIMKQLLAGKMPPGSAVPQKADHKLIEQKALENRNIERYLDAQISSY